VNFFGHATVACWFDRDPNFVFGAMLPDLAAMRRLRPPTSTEPAITRGIALHHATDAAFHGTRAFVTLAQTAREALLGRGVARGPARALAHIGTEILLDENLGRDSEIETTYLRALETADGARLDWKRPQDGASLVEMTKYLRGRGIARTQPPEVVARRLHRALESHPRLAFAAADEFRVAEWVDAFRPVVSEASDAVMRELQDRLGPALRALPLWAEDVVTRFQR
jgi:hypothetical protein